MIRHSARRWALSSPGSGSWHTTFRPGLSGLGLDVDHRQLDDFVERPEWHP
jgi:hypothetical protein